jgi:integrase
VGAKLRTKRRGEYYLGVSAGLRHTAASLMISSGANVKTVQSQLGHKTATMTLDQYGHLFPHDLDDVADKIDDLVSGCAQNVPTEAESSGENTL